MDFVLAVVKNDLDKARSFLQAGIDVNSPVLWNAQNTLSPVIPLEIASRPELMEKLQNTQEYSCRPLNVAVLGGHHDMVRLLLSAGADINLKDGRGRTAIICAIYGLDLDASNINTSNLNLISETHESHFELMKNILLRHPNLYVSTLDAPQYEIKGITPLCLASYLGKADIIQLLLDDGRVNVDGTDSKNATALMYAARDGNLPIVKKLLSYYASPDITDNHGWSAIQYAERSPEIVQLCEEALRCKRPDTALALASTNGNSKYPVGYTKLANLIASLPNYPSSLSHIEFETLKDVDLLDPNATPLIQIIQAAFLQAIKTHDHYSLQTMLLWSPPMRKGDRPSSGPLLVNHHDPKTGLTALHHAIRSRPLPSLDTIMMLYQAGADINAQTYYGRTALHHLARFGVDKDGKTWGIQKSAKQMSDRRERGGARRTQGGSTSPMTSPSIEPIPEDTISIAIPPSVTAQHRMSVQSAVSSKSSASESTSARGSATENGDEPTKSSASTSPVPQHLAMSASLLIRLGALVNIADPTGNTPLHFAAEFGGVPEVLDVLILEGNADLELRNKKNLTPLDVCKSDEVRKRILAIDLERRTALKTKSSASYVSGNIKPFETPADDRSTLGRSTSRSTIQTAFVPDGKWRDRNDRPLPSSVSEACERRTKKTEELDEVDACFEEILKAFFSYQTTFTDSIETDLAKITETILGLWALSNDDHRSSIDKLQKTIVKLRLQLREAQERFDETRHRTEKVMLHYQEELEQVEQIHQADWELSELQVDKVDKLTDVFERIDGRFTRLEADQEDLMSQVEVLRKSALRHLDQLGSKDDTKGAGLWDAIANLTQALLILEIAPVNPVLSTLEDRSHLCQDIAKAVDLVIPVLEAMDSKEATEALQTVQTKWKQAQETLLTAAPSDAASSAPEETSTDKPSKPAVKIERLWKKQALTAAIYSKNPTPPSNTLNQLELSFEILTENMAEIQKDLDDISQQNEDVLSHKKKMYNMCLVLEEELTAPSKGTPLSRNDGDLTNSKTSGKPTASPDRSEKTVRAELESVMKTTQQLFARQEDLEKERSLLKNEHIKLEQELKRVQEELRQVRPPLLLQGLLERLETTEYPLVRIQKDWKENNDLVTEVFEVEDDSTEDSSSGSETTTGSLNKNIQRCCRTRIATRCLIARLDASLYCLKVLAAHDISQSKQALLQVQTSLNQGRTELEETRTRMTVLYDDAAEVSQQVCTLNDELCTIIRHRSEEVVKVWEVVDEVNDEIGSNLVQHAQTRDKVPPQPADHGKKERIEEQDRHQWIVRELEQLQNVHEDLQETIEDLKNDQTEIGQHLRQFAASLIEPQVEILVGQSEASLLSVSDRLAELLDRIRDRDLGIVMAITDDTTNTADAQSESQVSPAIHTAQTTANRLSRASNTNKRLSMASARSSLAARSIADRRAPNGAPSGAMSTRTDKRRLSIMSISSFSSINSYQQDRMLSNASSIRSALSQAQRQAVSLRQH